MRAPSPAKTIAPIGALTPAAPAIGIASSPSAADIECCGLYHIDLTRLSTRSPLNRQLLMASMFRSVNSASGRPRGTSSHKAYSPSALAATTASTTANAVPTAESDAAHVAMTSAAMNKHAGAERVDLERIFDLAQAADALFTDDCRDEKVRPVVPESVRSPRYGLTGGMAYFVSSAVSAMCQMKSAVKYAR